MRACHEFPPARCAKLRPHPDSIPAAARFPRTGCGNLRSGRDFPRTRYGHLRSGSGILRTDGDFLRTALNLYKGDQTRQTGAVGSASAIRIDRNSLVKQATARRMWIQFAADAEWPHNNPTTLPIRREFQLPANRAFIG